MKQTIMPILLLLAFTESVSAEEQVKIINNQPSTISTQAKAFLSSWPGAGIWPQMPKRDDINAWKTIQTGIIKSTEQRIESLIKQYNLTITKNKINNVSVLDIRPKNFKDNGKVLIYIHGGAYTLYDAMSSMGASAVMAEATGLKIISIDYTTAPQSKWRNTLEQTTSVFKGLLEQGYSMEDMAIYGDSAGGALATGTVLKLRNENLGMPSSVVLWSPWADIDTSKGDTYATLASADPILAIDTFLNPSALAYADRKDFTHPYVSPVYGNYHKGFPPTLIQGGTKEMFLSSFVRLYQKMDTAGIEVKLDLYEGMPHIFQYLMLDTPESQIAVKKSANYILKHLGN
ncbi:alpha/beta hydrolase [Pseudoalteromonas sp. S201]|uniref:alpha/beta hydrolase n=1 Tax=Pseudoalteromonas sp. S201 TaxID=579519 RepID=UPI0014861476|nr:alpha/beta hydrolase [Pseudoalteromonas sp. S201]